MPNTPALVRQGCSVFVRGSRATDKDAFLTQQLLQSIGTCEEVAEYQMDAITALSGSGPAYVFVMIEALADGGVRMGLPRDLAYRLASQTVLGSGQLVRDSNRHPGQLKDDVTSPAGSTAAGLRHLEANGNSFWFYVLLDFLCLLIFYLSIPIHRVWCRRSGSPTVPRNIQCFVDIRHKYN